MGVNLIFGNMSDFRAGRASWLTWLTQNVVACLCLFVLPAVHAGQITLRFDPEVLAVLAGNPPARTDLVLTNESSSAIRVLQVNIDCNCTTIESDDELIPAGSIRRFPVAVHPLDEVRRREFGVTLKTDSPSAPTLNASLTVEIGAPFSLHPSRLQWVGMNAPATQIVVVRFAGRLAPLVKALRAPAGFVIERTGTVRDHAPDSVALAITKLSSVPPPPTEPRAVVLFAFLETDSSNRLAREIAVPLQLH